MAVADAANAQLRSFVDDAIAELGFDPAQKGDLEAGMGISVSLPDFERQPNELTVGAAMTLVHRPLAVVTEVLFDDATFRINSDILDYRVIGDGSESREDIAAIFRDIGYTKKEGAETTRLLRVKRGSEFNLGDAEIEQFRSIKGSGERARNLASTTLADILRQRFLAYLEGGLESVEPYVRASGRSASPRRELTVALSTLDLLERHFPNFYTSLLSYPERLSAGTSSQFYWIKRRVGKRPAFVLAHRLEQREDDYAVAAELQFYVGHSYNSMLILIACVPTEAGTLVLSIIRIFTDQVTGFASGMKRNIGRGQLVEAMADHLQEMREALENP